MAQVARAHIGQRVVVTLTESDIISHTFQWTRKDQCCALKVKFKLFRD